MKKLIALAAVATCGAALAVESANIVGYTTTEKVANDFCTFIGASFESVGSGTFIPFSSLTCSEGFEDGDQIQKAYVDEDGIVGFTVYEYWDGDGWVDPSSGDVIGDDIGFEVGEAAWFISSAAKQITTAGAVKSTNHIHTFTETSTVISSAFPVPFCPNSANVSWGSIDGDQIQVPYVDEDGIINFTTYEYWDGDGWVDPSTGDVLEADFAVTTAGKGFWFITADPENVSFTEVSPLAE